jgi:hypothetical protein
LSMRDRGVGRIGKKGNIPQTVVAVSFCERKIFLIAVGLNIMKKYIYLCFQDIIRLCQPAAAPAPENP